MNMKKTALLLAAMLLVLALSSCGIPERLALDSDLHNVIEIGYTDVWIEEIFYQGVRYVRCDLEIFGILSRWEPYEGDVMLSWNGPRFLYINTYYSNTTDSPRLIYEMCLGDFYFREDCDYMNEPFATSTAEMTLSDMLGDLVAEKGVELQNATNIPMSSKIDSRLEATMELGLVGEEYCVSFIGTEKVWQASDMLLERLDMLDAAQ